MPWKHTLNSIQRDNWALPIWVLYTIDIYIQVRVLLPSCKSCSLLCEWERGDEHVRMILIFYSSFRIHCALFDLSSNHISSTSTSTLTSTSMQSHPSDLWVVNLDKSRPLDLFHPRSHRDHPLLFDLTVTISSTCLRSSSDQSMIQGLRSNRSKSPFLGYNECFSPKTSYHDISK